VRMYMRRRVDAPRFWPEGTHMARAAHVTRRMRRCSVRTASAMRMMILRHGRGKHQSSESGCHYKNAFH
jgi:hypothetical protein